MIPPMKEQIVIAVTDKPKNKNPMAAPGRIAWEIASPLRHNFFMVKKIPTIEELKERIIKLIKAFFMK